MNGEYLLSLDPYNFDTEEEYIRFYHPELLEEIEGLEDETVVKTDVYKG